MGLFDRFRSAGRLRTGASEGKADTSEQDALRLIDEGNAIRRQGRIAEAMQRYEAAIRLAPNLARAHLNRGNVLLEMGDPDGALEAYATALVKNPDFAAAHYNTGIAHLRSGRRAAAVAAYRTAIALDPEYADAEVALGAALEELGQLDDAVACYRRALAINPDYAEVHCNLGNALKTLGRFDDALASYRRALAIRPDYAEAHNNLGIALKKLGQIDGAVASYRRAVAIKPDFAEAHNNLGNALKELGQLDSAVASYRRAVAIRDDYVEAHNNLGIALKDVGQFEDAVASLNRALAIKPDFAEAHNNLGVTLTELGQLDAAVASLNQALTIDPDDAGVHSNLLFIHNYLADQPASHWVEAARRYGDLVAREARPDTVWRNIPDPTRRLRVGFVSGDLRSHAVGHFAEAALGALAAEVFDQLEIIAYPTHFATDPVTERIKASCHGWHSAVGLSDEQLAQRIRDDGIDILIDLAGHTAHNRLSMFAWKPAPVQATWLGYLATTGVTAIDYVIADAWTLPETEESNFTEKICRIPESYLCFTPPANSIEVGPLPALSNTCITFGSFNNLTKMNDTVVALWARVLAAVPHSRLFLKSQPLKDASVRQSVIERFALHGIDAERLILEGPVPRADYLTPFQRVDMALDPFPYPGITTSVENLWMGVPVLTLAGKSFLSRQGVGLLMNVGLSEWIAVDATDYVARAVSHAGDLQRLASIRSGLRSRALSSPIFDAARFAHHFAAALRGMWQEWCRTRQDRPA